jgi:very-short-patch-repair endonuclease
VYWILKERALILPRADWRDLLRRNPSRAEVSLAERLTEARIRYSTQVELPVSTADFYFYTYPRPLVVYLDGPPHLKMSRAIKDEQIRRTLRMVGYRVLELPYTPRPGTGLKRVVDGLLERLMEELERDPEYLKEA